MPAKYKTPPAEKNALHPRNRHRVRYNFDVLVKTCPALLQYVALNEYRDKSINFADPAAVKTLNKALLMHFYKITDWDIPAGYLCPPVPGRADYIHYLADLLAEGNNGLIPQNATVLDVGVGANCIYPIIGCHEYGWTFIGCDIDPVAIKSARQIVASNATLTNNVELRLQTNPSNIYNGIINKGEWFDVTMCNPPFHSSLQEAEQGTRRKLTNLGKNAQPKVVLNFGGQKAELWCKGGEETFVRLMVEQSAQMPKQCMWYTTLISKKDNLTAIYRHLKKAGALDVRTINMAQGQKVSRIICWTFLTFQEQQAWRLKRWQ